MYAESNLLGSSDEIFLSLKQLEFRSFLFLLDFRVSFPDKTEAVNRLAALRMEICNGLNCEDSIVPGSFGRDLYKSALKGWIMKPNFKSEEMRQGTVE